MERNPPTKEGETVLISDGSELDQRRTVDLRTSRSATHGRRPTSGASWPGPRSIWPGH